MTYHEMPQALGRSADTIAKIRRVTAGHDNVSLDDR
jgi:hypothetical protein